MNEDKKECCKKVIPPGIHGHWTHPCKKKATVKREGNWYCKYHDPMAEQERYKKRVEKWCQESLVNNKQWALERAAPDLLEVAQLVLETASEHTSPDLLSKATKAVHKALSGY